MFWTRVKQVKVVDIASFIPPPTTNKNTYYNKGTHLWFKSLYSI